MPSVFLEDFLKNILFNLILSVTCNFWSCLCLFISTFCTALSLWELSPPTKVISWYETKICLMAGVHFLSSRECGISLLYHYSQVHTNPKWQYLLVKYNCLKVIFIWLADVPKKSLKKQWHKKCTRNAISWPLIIK